MDVSLAAAYLLCAVVMVVLDDRRRITNQQYNLCVIVLSAVAGMACAVHGWTLLMYAHAAVAVLHAWSWWNGGGGDGTRRRLKSWARRFHGVRRTAPSHA
jgi:hypothetical protein